MNWDALGVVGEVVGAAGSILIACLAVYIATRQWLDGKRISREQRELSESIERNNEAARQEQERIVRAQSLDSYFDGISTLLLREEDGVLDEMGRILTKGRSDSILKILKSGEKRNLVTFLCGSGLSHVDLTGITLRQEGLEVANFQGTQIMGADLDHSDLRAPT